LLLCKTWDNSEELEGEKEREVRCLTVGGRGGGAGAGHVVGDRVSVKRPRRSAVAMVKSVAASRRWLRPSRIG
jgi:hypothetical protein